MKIGAPYGGALQIRLVVHEVWVLDRNAYEKFGSIVIGFGHFTRIHLNATFQGHKINSFNAVIPPTIL